MPLIAVTLGNGRSSIALNTLLDSNVQAAISSSGRWKLAPNSVMSAPTMNTSLPLVTSRPLIAPSFFSAAPASPRSATVRASNLLIGSPWRSKRSSAKPFASLSTWMDCPWYRGVLDITNTRSEEHTSELQSLMRISYAVFCLKKKKQRKETGDNRQRTHLEQKRKTTYNNSIK